MSVCIMRHIVVHFDTIERLSLKHIFDSDCVNNYLYLFRVY